MLRNGKAPFAADDAVYGDTWPINPGGGDDLLAPIMPSGAITAPRRGRGSCEDCARRAPFRRIRRR